MPRNLVDRLIEQADDLAGAWTSQAGRPRDADLRRAVSAAYYALFHELTDQLAHWLAPNLMDLDREQLRRYPTHSGMKRVCGWVVNPGSASPKLHFAAPLAGVAASDGELANVAQVFRVLQDRRHEADYNHVAVFVKSAVLTDIEEAEIAIADLRASTGTVEFEAFTALLALCGGGAGAG